MFHLFRGTVIVPDCVSANACDSFIFSKFDNQHYTNRIAIDGVCSTPENVVFESVDAALSHYHSFVELFKDIDRHLTKSTKVYADKQSYPVLVCAFLKLLFARITSDVAYINYKLSLDKFYIEQFYINRNQMLGDDIDSVDMLSQSEFEQVFDSVILTDSVDDIQSFRNTFANHISTEYHIASVLSGDDIFEQPLASQLKKTLIKVFSDSVSEIYPFCLYDIYCPLRGNNLVTDSLTSCIKKHELSDVLTNRDFCTPDLTDPGKFDYVRHSQKIKSIAKWFHAHNDFGWDENDMQYVDKFIDLIQPDVSATEIVNTLLEQHDLKIFIYSISNNINCLLVQWVYDLYKQNDDKLKQFKW